jgi:hypothetical protein
MGKDNIDIRLLETLERALETLDDVLSAKTAGVGLLAASSEEDLCGEDVPGWVSEKHAIDLYGYLLVARPGKLLEGSAHLNLRFTVGVDLSGVESVDTMIPSLLENLLDDIALLGASICQPASKTEDTDLETGRSQVAEQHVLGVVGGFNGHFGGILWEML